MPRPRRNSELTDYPILAGQTTRYSYLQLKDYKSGRRTDEMMNAVAAGLEKQDMHDLAAYYASQRPKGPRIQAGETSGPFKPDPARVEAGRRNRPRCSAPCATWRVCRTERSPQGRRPASRVRHQAAESLQDWKANQRCRHHVERLEDADDEDIENLAHFLASL